MKIKFLDCYQLDPELDSSSAALFRHYLLSQWGAVLKEFTSSNKGRQVSPKRTSRRKDIKRLPIVFGFDFSPRFFRIADFYPKKFFFLSQQEVECYRCRTSWATDEEMVIDIFSTVNWLSISLVMNTFSFFGPETWLKKKKNVRMKSRG